MKRTVCNKCGKVADKNNILEFYNFSHNFGYGSIYDGKRITFDLCIDCMDEFVDKTVIDFKHNPFDEVN